MDIDIHPSGDIALTWVLWPGCALGLITGSDARCYAWTLGGRIVFLRTMGQA